MEINKFRMKRVNPFQGLVIDADTWKDAHNYHRENMKLHIFAFHDTGIVSGLEVTANNPPDASVNVSAGIAVDSEGNTIVLPQKQRYVLQSQDKGTLYLIIQFREILGEPFQPPEGGQPTRIVEAYRLQERDSLPSEPYVELARIEYDKTLGSVKNAKNPGKPAANEINLNCREEAVKLRAEPVRAPPEPAAALAQPAAVPPRESTPLREKAIIGYMPLGDGNKELHKRGLLNLAGEVCRRSSVQIEIEEDVSSRKSWGRYCLVYLTGNGRFELTAEQQAALNHYLQSGGVVFGDGCSAPAGGVGGKGAKEFGLAFNRLAGQLSCKLGMVQRGHPLLCTDYLFSEAPAGCEQPMLLEGGNMICASSDYGCAWDGGYADLPLARETIRSALEMGTNILSYAVKRQAARARS